MPPKRRRRRSGARILAGIVVAVAIGGLVAVLAGCGLSGPSAGATGNLSGSFEPSASAAPASPSESPGKTLSASAHATLDPASTGWKQVPDQAALGGASLYNVVWTGSRYLALDHGRPEAVFDSDTGLAWHRQPALPNVSRWGGPSILGAGLDGSVAIGGGGGGSLAIWHSKDGLAWTAAPDQASLDARDGTFARVNAVIDAADGLDLADGWLAVGGESYNYAPTPGLVRAVVWASPDGEHWRRQPDSSALLHAEMTGIVRRPSGYVAVGYVVADPSRGDSGLLPAVWTSPDGVAWTRSNDPPTFSVAAGAPGGPAADVTLDSIAVRGDRLVAVGNVDRHLDLDSTQGATLAVAWWSDGGAWSPVQFGLQYLSRGPSVYATPSGFRVIVGVVRQDCAAGLWSSPDGTSWTCTGNDPTFSGFEITAAAVSPDLELLIGWSGTSSAVWTLAGG